MVRRKVLGDVLLDRSIQTASAAAVHVMYFNIIVRFDVQTVPLVPAQILSNRSIPYTDRWRLCVGSCVGSCVRS